MRASAYTPEDLKEGLAELKNWRTPDHDVYEVAAQLFDERFRRSGEEILDLVLSLPSRRRLAAASIPRRARWRRHKRGFRPARMPGPSHNLW